MFCVLWPFSKVIAHSFGVPGRFTCFRVMTKNSSFLRFIAVFMSYCPKFWDSRAIYIFWSFDQKHVFFAIYGYFHDILPTVLRFQGDLHVSESPKTRLFCV